MLAGIAGRTAGSGAKMVLDGAKKRTGVSTIGRSIPRPELSKLKSKLKTSREGTGVSTIGRSIPRPDLSKLKSKLKMLKKGMGKGSFASTNHREELSLLWFLSRKFEVEPYNSDRHGPIPMMHPPPEYEVVEEYWVDEPYAMIKILHDRQESTYLYHVSEPQLSHFERVLLEELYDRLHDVLIMEHMDSEVDKTEMLKEKMKELLSVYAPRLEPVSFYKLFYYLKTAFLQFGRTNPVMNDPYVEDIMCNGFNYPTYVFHKNYGNIPSNVMYDEGDLDAFVIKLAQQGGKQLSLAMPIVGVTMMDGSRAQLSIGREITPKGSSFTIRKFKREPLTPVDLVAWGTFSLDMVVFLWLATEYRKSMIIAGGTATGKTSSLNAISFFIPPQSRIVSLEDTREIQLTHENWVPMISRDEFASEEKEGDILDMYDLLRASLRQRPEYLIVGEVRGVEAQVLFQAMNTGHTTFSTLHANSVDAVANRLTNPPINVPLVMLNELDYIVIQTLDYVGGRQRRRVKKIAEIVDIEGDSLKTNEVFTWDSTKDEFHFKSSKIFTESNSVILNKIKMQAGWSEQELNHEIESRKQVITYLLKKGIRDYRQITALINAYYRNPKSVLEQIEAGKVDVV